MTKHFLFLVVIATALCDVSRPLLLMRQSNLNADSVSPQHKPVSAFIFGDIKKISSNLDGPYRNMLQQFTEDFAVVKTNFGIFTGSFGIFTGAFVFAVAFNVAHVCQLHQGLAVTAACIASAVTVYSTRPTAKVDHTGTVMIGPKLQQSKHNSALLESPKVRHCFCASYCTCRCHIEPLSAVLA